MKIILLILLVILGSCSRKFPEDEHYSFDSPAERLYGTWLLSSYTVNGQERKEELSDLFFNCFGTFAFLLNGEPGGFRMYGDDCLIKGSYSLSDRNKKIKIIPLYTEPEGTLNFPLQNNNFAFFQGDAEWNIIRLEKTLVLETHYKGAVENLVAVKIQ